jgi:hypothetical protein
MATNFKSFPAHLPEDGQNVWIRRFSVTNDAEPACWDYASETFKETVFDSCMPWWFVVQWKNRPTP